MSVCKSICAALFVILCTLGVCACQSNNSPNPDFSGYKDVAEFATLECYYHNVAEIKNDGTDIIFGMVNIGYEKAWFEYRGSVRLGVDASMIEVSNPDESGVVTIRLPQAGVVGTPDIDTTSMTDVVSDTGLLTQITAEEKTKALNEAQSEMKQLAESDETLKRQASERVRILLEEYVTNVGNALGVQYTVNFEEIEPE